jgi:hypothetical protein
VLWVVFASEDDPLDRRFAPDVFQRPEVNFKPDGKRLHLSLGIPLFVFLEALGVVFV